MVSGTPARLTARMMFLVCAVAATLSLFMPFVAEFDDKLDLAPAHLRSGWSLSSPSPFDGGQQVSTAWAVTVVVATLVLLAGSWLGSHLDHGAPLVAAGVAAALGVVAGFVVRGEGVFGDDHRWATEWGLSVWQTSHALALVALVAFWVATVEERAEHEVSTRP